jgi:S1-C subfamily serine protease
MRHAVLLVSLLIAVVANAAEWPLIADALQDSTVYLETTGGSCTAFVIHDAVIEDKDKLDYLLTAAHCDGEKLFADGQPASMVWKDTKKDLMVLSVKDTGRPALTLAKRDAQIGQEVASYGYGYGFERPMFRVSHIADDRARVNDQDYLMIDAAFVGGMSGGAVVNHDGQVVMIVQLGTDRAGMGVGAETIEDKAGRFFVKQP